MIVSEPLTRIIARIEAAGWSWTVDGAPGQRNTAWVHVPGEPQHMYRADGCTPELALIGAYRKAVLRRVWPERLNKETAA